MVSAKEVGSLDVYLPPGVGQAVICEVGYAAQADLKLKFLLLTGGCEGPCECWKSIPVLSTSEPSEPSLQPTVSSLTH